MSGRMPVLPVRRRLLRSALWLPLLVMAPRPSLAALADLRRFGVRGDGRHDDTLALQRAVDAVPGGGVLDLPPGSYLVDPVRSLRLHSRMHLRLARGARLVAKPNAAPRGYVLLVERASDVRISGGRIVGERHAHLGRSGEWGHGIMVRGASRVSISSMRISDCWGDGISIGASKLGGGRALPSSDIDIAGVACIGNRRQGLTIGRSRRVRVRDCEFSGTGGTAPQAGIDVEPDAGDVAQDVRIERCVVRGNRGPGIQVWKRTRDIAIVDCTIEGNRNAGVLAVGATGLLVSRNRIRGNPAGGVVVRGGSNRVRVAGNRFQDNGRPGFRHGMARHVRVADDTGSVVVAGDNRAID
jgi:nitrous oxidase accessory protein NosD